MVTQDVLVQNAEGSSSSVFSVIQDMVMQDINPPLSGLANQDIIMQGPDAPYPIPAVPLNQPFTSGFYVVWGKENITICRCIVCVQAGYDGKICKGKNNQKHCEFIEVCLYIN